MASVPGATISQLSIGSTANPTTIAIGPDGNIWYIQGLFGSGTLSVGRFDANGANGQSFPIAPPSGCHGLSLGAIGSGPDGNVYVTYSLSAQSCNAFKSQGGLVQITPVGTVTVLPPLPNVINAGESIATGPDGNIWFTDSSNARVFRVTTGGVSTMFNVTAPTGTSRGIVTGPDGNLWIAFGSKVVQLSVGGSSADVPMPDIVRGIAAGPDGNLWLTEDTKGNVIRLTTAGVVTEFPAATVGTRLTGIATGADNNIWFIEATTRQLDRLLLSSASSATRSIASVHASAPGTATIDKQALPAGTDSPKDLIKNGAGNLYAGGDSSSNGSSTSSFSGVYEAVVAGCPSITVTVSTSSLLVGIPTTVSLSATGGTAPYAFAVTGLPPGLTASANLITGKPTQSGSFEVTITVSDSGGCTGQIRPIFVVATCPAISVVQSFPTSIFRVGSAVNGTLTATNGTAPYAFNVSGLPPGLSLSGNQITGSPTQQGTFSVTITATDANGCSGTLTSDYVVLSAGCDGVAIDSSHIPTTQVTAGVPMTPIPFFATGGAPPYRFFAANGFPFGVSLTPSGAGVTIGGTPLGLGVHTATITITDSNGCKGNGTIILVVIGPATPCSVTVTPDPAKQTVQTFETIRPVHINVAGTRPNELEFRPSFGSNLRFLDTQTITGSFAEPGVYRYTVSVTDGRGCTGSATFEIDVVDACPTGHIRLSGPTEVTIGTAVSLDLTNTLLKPATYSVIGGGLPEGLTLTGSTISGTPKKAGFAAVVIAAKFKDQPNCELDQTFVFNVAGPVAPPPTCSLTFQVPAQAITTADTAQITLSDFLNGGSGPYAFNIDAPVDGTALSGNVLTAHFDTTGQRTVAVTAKDSNQCPAHATIVFNVSCPSSSGFQPLDDQPCPASPELELIKVHYATVDGAGNKKIKYQFVLLNKGKNAYTGNVDMSDPLPTAVNGDVTASDGAVYDAKSRTISFKNAVSLAPGAWTRLGTAEGTLTADDGVTVTNTATAKADGVKGAMTATDPFVVGGGGGDIDVKKQHDGFDRTSTPFIWTIEITNKGKGNLDSLELVELLPPGAVVDEKAFDNNQLGVDKFSVSGSTMRISLKQGAPFFPLAPGKKAVVKIPFKSLPAGPLNNSVLVWGGKASSAAFGRDSLK